MSDKPKRKVTFFLGAGFSKAFGFPVMNDFFRHARESGRLTSDQKGALEELQLRARAVALMVGASDNNLEDVLSMAYAPHEKHTEEFPASICEILRRIFSDPKRMREKDRVCKRFGQFIGGPSFWEQYELSVLTTNYDLCIETLLNSQSVKTLIPGEWSRGGTQTDHPFYVREPHPGYPTCRLAKLHGSINWHRTPDNDAGFVVADGLAELMNPDAKGSTWLPEVCASNYQPPSTPIILPPTLFKLQEFAWIQEVWLEAAQALRDTDELVFVGYSFPESDTHMRFFIGSCLTPNVALQRIFIIDPSAETIVDRLQKSDSGWGPKFREILNKRRGIWENVVHLRDWIK